MTAALAAGRRRAPWAAVAVLAGVAGSGANSGCAGGLAQSPAHARPVVAGPGEAGWRALVDGHVADAEKSFQAERTWPVDPWVALGAGTIAYERGDDPAALENYLALLERLAAAGTASGDAVSEIAVLAATRVGELLDEMPATADVARAEQRVLALPRARLTWEARVELARAEERLARRRGDAALMDRLARAAACVRDISQIGAAGTLPHLDLEGPLSASSASASASSISSPPPAAGSATPTPTEGSRAPRSLLTPGCRVSVPSWDARPGPQVLRTSFDVAAAGRFSLVLDFSGEARVRVDGGAFLRHGDERRYGPRVSRALVRLAPGRHEIELRVATPAGRAELAFWIMSEDAAAGAAASGQDPPVGSALAVAADYVRAFVAERLGESDRALALAASLARHKTFAPGLQLAAGIAHGDPTRPAGFARDAARALWKSAVEREPTLARAWYALAELELDAEHPRDAIAHAQRAARGAAHWWPPELALAGALRSRGLDWDADRALDRAAEKAGPVAGAPCSVVAALFRRADERRDLAAQAPLLDRLVRCDVDSSLVIDRLRSRGDLDGALALLRRRVALDPDREDLRTDLAGLLLARRDFAGARAELGRLIAEDPSDVSLRVRLADAEVAAGDAPAARRTLAVALARRPDQPDVRRAARAAGLGLPLDDLRIDGEQVIREFRASGRHYAAPAVMVLDRTVHGVYRDGAELILTHNIVAVETKDGIERWGEVTVPAGAEVLMLRNHKRDGSTREPEEIAGKDAVSVPDLSAGDFVEWETLESKSASDAFAPGFLGDRFYFQSFDAPLDRSEYVLITPASLALDVDARAGAPAARVSERRGAGGEPMRVTTFATREVPQLFAERSSVPAVEYVPSVRVSSAVSWRGWARFLREQLYGTWRSSPAIVELAARLASEAPAASKPADRASRIVRWVTDNIEAGDDLRDPASTTLARGRGNRLALVLALAHELGVESMPELARSRLVAEADGALPPQEVDDFGDTVVRFDVGGPAPVYADLRLRHASFGYLPANLDGAKTLSIDGGAFGVAHGGGAPDQRTVDVTIRLDEKGGGKAMATEELTGWPALEWAELMDRIGSDQTKLRQDFEQRWLGVQFPGAKLDDLRVDLAPGVGGAKVTYSFVSPQLGVRSDQEIKLAPTFFRSQPGRRFATEPRRSTTLMMGYDVPVRLTATVVLPSAARVVEPATPATGPIARRGSYRFVEERTARPGSPEVLLLHRESALPLTRVPPTEYAGVAADLRRVDGLEQQEIRIRLHGAIVGRGAGAGAR